MLSKNVFDEIESDVRSYCRDWPVVFTTAAGSVLTAEGGREYLDFFAGAGVLNYGHNHPRITEALIEYLRSSGVVHSLDMYTVAKREFLESFRDLILRPRNLQYKVMFPGPTGTNAVESALKLARKVTGRQHVMSFTNAFHGMTLGALSVTGNAMKRRGAGVPLTNATVLPYDGYLPGEIEDSLWLERTLEDSGSGVDRPAAIIVETVQGEGGLNAARPEWLRRLSDLCRRYEIVLIVDDVQAGVGRTGTYFSFEESGITPDIVCLSKALTGFGLPMALTLIRPDLDVWEPGEHNGTFRGNNLSFVAATEAMRLFWSDGAFERTVRARSAELREGLVRIAADYEGASVRGRGLLTGIKFPDSPSAAKIAQAAFRRGLLVETCGPDSEVVKVMPPLTISPDELARGIDVLAGAVADVLNVPASGMAVDAR